MDAPVKGFLGAPSEVVGQFYPTVFAHDWLNGVSIVKVKGANVAKIDAILEDPEARTALLQRLSEKIKSERDRQRMSACA